MIHLDVNIAGINYIVSLPNATPNVGENRRENREKRHQPAGITTVERMLVVFQVNTYTHTNTQLLTVFHRLYLALYTSGVGLTFFII